MQCNICKTRTATVHLTEIIDGQRTESHLCQSCAQKEGITIKSQLSLNELLGSLIAAHQQPDEQGQGEAEKSCPVCGMTMEIFRKQALLGCPKDYEIFERNLQVIIEKAHDGNLTHKGKFPPGISPQTVCSSDTVKDEKETKTENELDSAHSASSGRAGSPQVETLEKQLEQAVRDEDYELAAKLRDQIKALQ
ncbi:MAG: UvrB/UvrC motif-containing protein [Sedimentisphaerales bacterium]